MEELNLRRFIFLFLILLIFSPAIVNSTDTTGNVNLGISGGWISSKSSPDSVFGRSSIGINLSRYFSVDLTLLSNFSRSSLIFMSLDSFFIPFPQQRLTPFLVIGAGAGIVDENENTSTKALFNAGGGLQYSLSEDIAVRIDLRNYFLDGRSDLAASLGFVFYFNHAEPSPPSAPAKESAIVPEQGSLILVKKRQQEVQIEEKVAFQSTASIPEESKLSSQEIIEAKTKEMSTLTVEASEVEGPIREEEGKVQVEKKKLEVQKEQLMAQGPDAQEAKSELKLKPKRRVYEKAPFYGDAMLEEAVTPSAGSEDTREASKVFQKEHTEEEPIKLGKNSLELTIEFNVRETEIGAEQSVLLLKFIEMLRDKKYKKIIIEGHACAHGNKKLNLLISKKRAFSAKRYLQAHGIKRHISIKYFGEERLRYKEIPTPDNINDPHVKANRRVRIKALW